MSDVYPVETTGNLTDVNIAPPPLLFLKCRNPSSRHIINCGDCTNGAILKDVAMFLRKLVNMALVGNC